MSGTTLEVENVSAFYGSWAAVSGVSFTVAPGELLALLGPSGCGKTTLLKLIAGLMDAAAGEIRFDGQSMTGVPAERRGASMVFQKPLLFPYMNVSENVNFGLKMRNIDAFQARFRIENALKMVQMDGFERRRAGELSGGQEQRVALARALVIEPKLLLLDEPFSSLDENLRAEMATLVRSLQKRLGITTVFVTHNQEEAASLADRIALMLDGRIEQVGSPRDFYTSPATLRAAVFFGWQTWKSERGGVVAFRPENARIEALAQPVEESDYARAMTVERSTDLGARIQYLLRTRDGEPVEITTAAPHAQAGTPVLLKVTAELALVFR